jgi:hypothetical protein
VFQLIGVVHQLNFGEFCLCCNRGGVICTGDGGKFLILSFTLCSNLDVCLLGVSVLWLFAASNDLVLLNSIHCVNLVLVDWFNLHLYCGIS